MRKGILWGGYLTLAILFTFTLTQLGYHGYFHLVRNLQSLIKTQSVAPVTLKSFLGIAPLPYYGGVGLVVSAYLGHIAYRASRSFGKLNQGQHGTARWATKTELNQQYDTIPMQSNEEYSKTPGVVISMEKKANKLYIDNSPTNNLIIGTTRSGKGETFIFPSIDALSRSKEKPSLVINDPKGEFVASTSKTLQDRGYRIEILNISDPSNSMQYNPLKLVVDAYKRGAIDEAELLCDTLTYSLYHDEGSNRSEGTFFADGSQALTNAIILALTEDCVTKGEEEKVTLYTVASFLTEYSAVQPNGQSAMDLYFDALPPGNPAKNQYAQLRMSEGKTRASILSNTMSKLTQFTLTNIAQMTASQDFDMQTVGFPIKDQYTINAVLQVDGKEVTIPINSTQTYSKKDADHLMTRLTEKPIIDLIEVKTNRTSEPLHDQISLQHEMYQKHGLSLDKTLQALENLAMQGAITNYRGTSRYYHTISKAPFIKLAREVCQETQEIYFGYLHSLVKQMMENLSEKSEEFKELLLPKQLVKASSTPPKYLLPNHRPTTRLTEEERVVFEAICSRFCETLLPTNQSTKTQVDVRNIISHRGLLEATSKSRVDFIRYEIKALPQDQPVAIFMVTPDYDKSKHFLASTFVRQLYYVLAKTATFHPSRRCERMVHFILDEFGSMPMIESMDSIITVCLSRNIRFSLIIQSYEQLDDNYKSVGTVIKENCSNTIYILSSNYDTCDDISKKCGDITIVDIQRSGDRFSLSKNEHEAVRSRRLILADDLLRMPIHQSIVLRATKRTDRRGKAVDNFPIFNRGDSELVPRWKYLIDIFPDGLDSADITRERYRNKKLINLKELHYQLPTADERSKQAQDEMYWPTTLKREIKQFYKASETNKAEIPSKDEEYVSHHTNTNN
ncbi:MAG TPA: type IV secretory system conjugative DNA transfer family protein [Tissierellia bacterium]|nr:type IV secretory system conjugative DNA transfer family protein [Tissierellia bacterium]